MFLNVLFQRICDVVSSQLVAIRENNAVFHHPFLDILCHLVVAKVYQAKYFSTSSKASILPMRFIAFKV